jgi:DNA-binding PadR family transcriptional regulator
MQHRFDTEIAKQYDIVTAILLDNFYFWIKQNEVNERNFKDGRYWTYNSKKAIAEWFPYLNERQLDYALKKMVEQGLIIKGNYNENKFERKLWYAITDFGYSILQNCKMYDNAYNIDLSITSTNTSTKTDNKEIDWCGFDFSEEVKSKIVEWLEYKKEKKQSYKNRGFSAFCKQRYEEILKYGDKYVIDMIDYSMCQNYSGVFPPKNNTKGATNEVAIPKYSNTSADDAMERAMARALERLNEI